MEPEPVKARAKAATPSTRLYSYPPLFTKKPFWMWTLKTATTMTLIAAAAPRGMNNPSASRMTTSGFGQAGEKSMTPTRAKSQPFFKELSCAIQPESAEPTKQHLRSVRGERQSNCQSQQENTDV